MYEALVGGGEGGGALARAVAQQRLKLWLCTCVARISAQTLWARRHT